MTEAVELGDGVVAEIRAIGGSESSLAAGHHPATGSGQRMEGVQCAVSAYREVDIASG